MVKIKIQIVVESDNEEEQVIQEVAEIERGPLQPENLGLRLTERAEKNGGDDICITP